MRVFFQFFSGNSRNDARAFDTQRYACFTRGLGILAALSYFRIIWKKTTFSVKVERSKVSPLSKPNKGRCPKTVFWTFQVHESYPALSFIFILILILVPVVFSLSWSFNHKTLQLSSSSRPICQKHAFSDSEKVCCREICLIFGITYIHINLTRSKTFQNISYQNISYQSYEKQNIATQNWVFFCSLTLFWKYTLYFFILLYFSRLVLVFLIFSSRQQLSTFYFILVVINVIWMQCKNAKTQNWEKNVFFLQFFGCKIIGLWHKMFCLTKRHELRRKHSDEAFRRHKIFNNSSQAKIFPRGWQSVHSFLS